MTIGPAPRITIRSRSLRRGMAVLVTRKRGPCLFQPTAYLGETQVGGPARRDPGQKTRFGGVGRSKVDVLLHRAVRVAERCAGAGEIERAVGREHLRRDRGPHPRVIERKVPEKTSDEREGAETVPHRAEERSFRALEIAVVPAR